MNFKTFCRLWDDKSVNKFELKTSGSTGAPKTIYLERKWLEYSAKQTQKALGIKEGKIYCCIPTDKVGGFMMMVRAKVLGLDIDCVEPCSDPMQLLDLMHDFTFISLVPMQLKAILQDTFSIKKINRFSHVLIGGGPIDKDLEEKIQGLNPAFYHTYAMTETYSHVALKKLNGTDKQNAFHPLPEVEIKLNDTGCLIINTVYAKNLTTTDLAVIYPDNSFEIIGRSDFAINTGGIKILPEAIEKLISETGLVKSNFAVSSITDKHLGEKIVLVIEGIGIDSDKLLENLKLVLPKYHHPQQIFTIPVLPLLDTGKLNRVELKKMLVH
ncbi:MAG: AMP-binding protein [Bacteroidetes bacterium]|nr:AMP-binding protein [Bacteroidota bacterium]